MKKTAALALAFGLISAPIQADDFFDHAYAGGGLSINSVTGWDNATGFQIFGGYNMHMVNIQPFTMAVEVGYFDSGSFEFTETFMGETFTAKSSASGLWANAVFAYPINEQFRLIGRAGLDLGDDDGPMFGIGVGYDLNRQLDLRAEYVTRDNVDSMQVNLAFNF